jgi:hypothetical protein
MAKLTIQQIISRIENEGATAYQIATLLNVQLEAHGFKPVRPQMIYNYDRNGMVVKGVKDVTKTRRFSMTEVTEFIDRFVTNKISKASPAPAATVETEDDMEMRIMGSMEPLEI